MDLAPRLPSWIRSRFLDERHGAIVPGNRGHRLGRPARGPGSQGCRDRTLTNTSAYDSGPLSIEVGLPSQALDVETTPRAQITAQGATFELEPLASGETRTLGVSLKVQRRGRYVLPPVVAHDLNRPALRSTTEGSLLVVGESGGKGAKRR